MLNEGDPVTVLKSNHSDVHKGTKGIVESIRGEGYAVQITGRFGMSEKERSADQTRTI